MPMMAIPDVEIYTGLSVCNGYWSLVRRVTSQKIEGPNPIPNLSLAIH